MFGLFDEAKACDWCGADVEGDGVSDGAMVFCSQACLDQKNAPPVQRTAAEQARAKPMTYDVARSELGIADSEVQHYMNLAQELDSKDQVESEFMRSQEALLGTWRILDTVRAYVAARGGDVAHYDKQRQAFASFPDRYDYRTVRNLNGNNQTIGFATFRPENAALVHAAHETMCRALDSVGPE